jgi:hypothetical protein
LFEVFKQIWIWIKYFWSFFLVADSCDFANKFSVNRDLNINISESKITVALDLWCLCDIRTYQLGLLYNILL